ncbi:hypothetical protein AAY473_037224 [Plecturocebus cupreus]
MGISISSGGDLETLPQQVSPHNHVASSIKSSKQWWGFRNLAQQALQCNCVVAAYISNKDLETLTQQALQHDLMASFFTQSTVAKHSSQQSTVHQAEQPDAVLAPPKDHPEHRGSTIITEATSSKLAPEAELACPSSSWAAKAARRCISILMRGPNKHSCITTWPPPIKSSSSSGGDLETLAQQALQCNCVVQPISAIKI